MESNLKLKKAHLIYWSVGCLFLFLLALALWLLKPNTPGLKDKLDVLAIFFILVPVVFTGLIAWPVAGWIALKQFHTSRIPQHTAQRFALTLPFRWQTFAYPLPGLRRYLTQLC